MSALLSVGVLSVGERQIRSCRVLCCCRTELVLSLTVCRSCSKTLHSPAGRNSRFVFGVNLSLYLC